MLESLAARHETVAALRLASIPPDSNAALVSRGIDATVLPEVRDRLRAVGVIMTTEEWIDRSFKPSQEGLAPFGLSRFSDGTWAVFYAAVDKDTCVAEVIYHQRRHGERFSATRPRNFVLFEVTVNGSFIDLVPLKTTIPELTSADESGYPKCREIARQALSLSVDALRTASARRPDGFCTPVFARSAIAPTARPLLHGQLVLDAAEIVVFREFGEGSAKW